MTQRFSIYYHSQENGAYLQQVVNSLPQSLLVATDTLSNLPPQLNSQVDVVWVEYQGDNPKLDRWLEKTTADRQNPAVFLYLKELSTGNLLKALRLGIRECFTFPIPEAELTAALARLQPRPLVDEESVESTQLLAFLGTKGGVGTSFLTANLAYLLAEAHKKRILVVDLDLRYGQLIYFFDARPQYNLISALKDWERLDSAYLKGLLYLYGSHLYLLPAPARIEEAEAVTPENLEKILRYLKNMRFFSLILVDAGSRVDEVILKALELSDKTILVTTPSLPALSNTKKLLELLHLLGLEDTHLEVWLNAWQEKGDLSRSEVAAFLATEVAQTLPADAKEVDRSINEGKPLAQTTPGNPVSRELKGVAGKILGLPEAPTGFFSRLFHWLRGKS
jgi:pilus assembly protein CpaE